jgi:hypothetical protein
MVMAGTPLHIQSISQLHELMGYEKPKHPLVTIMDMLKK